MDEKIVERPVDKSRILFSKIKRRALKHVQLIRFAIITAAVALLYLVLLTSVSLVKRTPIYPQIGLLSDFVFTPTEKIKSIDGRTNILILGKGGVGHEAPDLTDTIIFASVAHKDPSISLIPLPRDIWVTDLRAKLNSAYYWGNKKQKGGGLVLAKSTAEAIVGEPISYVVVVDFSGFKRIIDVLGGVDVDVEVGFVDSKYPIPGKENDLCGGDKEFKCRYETIRFEKGVQHMDGETALKFVRSRNAEGDEGTDIARSKRQQRIIQAIKSRVLQREILLSPKKLLALRDEVFGLIETDISSPEAAILARRFLQADDAVYSLSIPEEYLVNPPIQPKYDNLYVFIPRVGDWQEVWRWVDCKVRNLSCASN